MILLSAFAACGDAGDAGDARGLAVHIGLRPLDIAGDALCARTIAGSPSADAMVVGLARLHALRRFFGVHGSYREIDERLVAALGRVDALTTSLSQVLAIYVGDDDNACTIAASFNTMLGEAKVTMVGDVALIRPGVGSVKIPERARALVVDLGNLPNVPELRAALARAVRPALDGEPRWLSRSVRQHLGMTDEVVSEGNVYKNSVIDVPGEILVGDPTVDELASLPMALLTDARMPPAAAEIAALLRLDQRAWLFGADVLASVAEAQWVAVADRGALVRVSDMTINGARIPDVVHADDGGSDMAALISALPTRGAPSPTHWGAASRRRMIPMTPFGDGHMPSSGLGEARAALVMAHGAARMFFPYFEVVGDDIDARLGETLASLDGVRLDRALVRLQLRRFAEVLSDGDALVLDLAGTIDPDGLIPVVVEHIDGEPVVRRSLDEQLSPGDIIVAIDGVAMSAFYAKALASTSAASDGYRLSVASRRWRRVAAPVVVSTRDADGAFHETVIAPSPMSALEVLGFAPSLRAAGWLADLGAPSLYYINLSQDVMYQLEAFRAAIVEAKTATGVVLDMRGYPASFNQLEYIARVVQTPAASPQFRLPRVDITQRTSEMIQYSVAPAAEPRYHGPVALLVGHNTVSVAENLVMMLVDAERVTVVGRPTAATNGNITGLQLPCGFGFTFTGMDVRHADGLPFHAVGITPEVEAIPTAEALRDGVDPELMAAIDVLGGS
jgi:hypothetical protein